MTFDAPFISLAFGVVLFALYGWTMQAPEKALAAYRLYPRSIWPGRILMAISVIWFAYNLNQVDLGGFNTLKKALWVLVPVICYLIVRFIPDLLSVRALCTFCLLAGKSVLIAVRWQSGPAPIAVALLIYLLMVKCMFLVVYPHFWLRGISWLEAKPGRLKPMLFSGMAVAVALIVSGFLSLKM